MNPPTATNRDAERIKAELREELAALDAYEKKHGSFTAMMREYYAEASEGPVADA
jgi:hypothetical protein